MARKEKKSGPDEPVVPAWVVTYGDMMSLLLTFFVLLVSFSTISEEDFKNAMQSLQGALGVADSYTPVLFPYARPARKQDEAAREAEEFARRLKRVLQVTGRAYLIQIDYDATGGVKITLPDAVLFDAGSAALKASAAQVLQDISTLLMDLPATFIEVRGHTDNSPLTTSPQYRDNHELSYWRADAVARRLVAQGGVELPQIEIVACGDGQPVAPNDTEEGRSANRRVDIYIRGLVDRERIEAIDERFENVGGAGHQPVTPGVDLSQPQGR